MSTLTDKTTNPIIVRSGATVTPFSAITVSDPLGTFESLSVFLKQQYGSGVGVGTLSDPAGGSFNAGTGVFTETGIVTSAPTPASDILSRLTYTAPTFSDGSGAVVIVPIVVNGTIDPTPVRLNIVTPPLVTGTVANQVVASGSTIRPFGAVQITDNNFDYSAPVAAAITLTDGGSPTDADGLLTGVGIGKTGVGTYSIGPVTGGYSLASTLQNLIFTPVAVGAGGTRTTAFDLNVTDTRAMLSKDDKFTSVEVIGPAVAPVPPLIAGTQANQTVAPGNAIAPFLGVTVSDANPDTKASATLIVEGGGTLSGSGLVPGAAGVWTIAAVSPADLTATLNHIIFSVPAGSQTNTIKIEIADNAGKLVIDTRTSIKETVPPVVAPPGSGSDNNDSSSTPDGGGNFIIANQTTGQQSAAAGIKYTGPVAGIDREFDLITPDNLNITAQIPNVFINSGSGMDALDVSKSNGNNVLNGGEGSNFLTGGTGFDTFFLDYRNPTVDLFSTIVNFHSGDNLTIFGINQTDYMLKLLDNQGAVNAKGLDFAVDAPGKPHGNVVLAGFSNADIGSGKLTLSYGRTQDLPGLPGSEYLNIHGN
jgi:hypothetical protein